MTRVTQIFLDLRILFIIFVIAGFNICILYM